MRPRPPPRWRRGRGLRRSCPGAMPRRRHDTLSPASVCRIRAMPMPVKIAKTEIPDVLVVETGAVRDDRGFFSETYSSKMFEAAGFRETFLQDNLSGSKRGT